MAYPENLAFGVALIGASLLAVAALSASILLSNLPEAAGGAKEMANNENRLAVYKIASLVFLLQYFIGNKYKL